MSHMRSESVSGDFGDLGERLMWISVHDWAVERSEVYLAAWSGVRVAGGDGLEAGVGCSNGILDALSRPSIKALLGGGR